MVSLNGVRVSDGYVRARGRKNRKRLKAPELRSIDLFYTNLKVAQGDLPACFQGRDSRCRNRGENSSRIYGGKFFWGCERGRSGKKPTVLAQG